MRGLRVKIAAIIIASIVAVVLVATGITALMLTAGEAARMVGPVARQIVLTSALQEDTTPPRRRWLSGKMVTEFPKGEPLPALTRAMQQELASEGETRKVEVIETDDQQKIAVLSAGEGKWMLFSFPPPPRLPSSVALALFGWLALVVIGVVGVALFVAVRVTRPLAMLEQTVDAVGPDGVLPHTPETGSGEMRRVARVLNGLSEQVKSALESRMRLVAAAGHDLRTPMTRMRLRAEFLNDEERQEWLTDLDELEAIADSAIKLVREEGAGADRDAIALDALVRETVSELQSAKLPVSAEALTPATVSAGPLALKRALRNLITNAATHGGGAHVRIGGDDDGGTAQVIIEDDGPGIPEELLGRVFEPFFRANPGRSQTIKGAGLGLAIAREIVERFGGTIEIRNRPEGGLQQIVTLRATEV